MRLLSFMARRALAEGGSTTSGHSHHQPELTDEEWTMYICIVIALVLLAGLMSGLTLGSSYDLHKVNRCAPVLRSRSRGEPLL